tara:strand:+ start:58 stop:432 length:375 start_codon:yes stop_codon:yes gene_type:complete
MASEEQQVILGKYNTLKNECQAYVNKISELEVERNEHDLVIKTLIPLDTDRIAHRLVQGVLVERSVGEVLPVVQGNRQNIQNILEKMADTLEAKNKEANKFKEEHNIRTEEEARQIERQQKGGE